MPRPKLMLALGLSAFTIGTDFTGAIMLVTPIEREHGVDITTTRSESTGRSYRRWASRS